jgi:hypothetical protein
MEPSRSVAVHYQFVRAAGVADEQHLSERPDQSRAIAYTSDVNFCARLDLLRGQWREAQVAICLYIQMQP